MGGVSVSVCVSVSVSVNTDLVEEDPEAGSVNLLDCGSAAGGSLQPRSLELELRRARLSKRHQRGQAFKCQPYVEHERRRVRGCPQKQQAKQQSAGAESQ